MNRRSTFLVAGALVAAAALGAAAAVDAAGGDRATAVQAPPPTAGTIVFVRGSSNARELYSIRDDGTGLRRLTRDRAGEGAPRWSPDGRRIAFSRQLGLDDELFVMDADGRNVRQLTRNGVQDLQPVWSPDGRHLAFVSDRGRRGEPELWIMRADGTKPRRLVRTVNHRTWQDSQYNPAWSPDGERVYFSMAVAEGNPELFVVGVNGKGLRRLTRTAGDAHRLGDDTMPHVSPDGRAVVFVSNRNRVSSDVWVMRHDGSRQRRLAGVAGHDEWFPRYSPDGAQVLFTDWQLATNRSWVAVVKADGTGARRITPGSEGDWAPAR